MITQRRLVALAWASLIVGLRHAIYYGWLAAHTHWIVERLKNTDQRGEDGHPGIIIQ